MDQAEDAADNGDRNVKRDMRAPVGVAKGVKRQPPGDEEHGEHRREHVELAQKTQGAQVADAFIAMRRPEMQPRGAEEAKRGRNIDREIVRRDAIKGVTDRERVRDQDEIEKGNLFGDGGVLGPDEFDIIARNSEKPSRE